MDALKCISIDDRKLAVVGTFGLTRQINSYNFRTKDVKFKKSDSHIIVKAIDSLFDILCDNDILFAVHDNLSSPPKIKEDN